MTNNKPTQVVDFSNPNADKITSGSTKQMTNNKNMTAVEQFLNAIKNQIPLSKEHLEMVESYAEQCKEIEKKQQNQLSTSWAKSREQTRETAMHIGFAKGFMSGLECHEDYYEQLNGTQLDEDEFTRNYIVDEFEKTYGGNK